MSSKKKKDGSSVKIYARVRKLMPWEPTQVSVTVIGNDTVQNKTDKKTSEYTFSHIFNMKKKNEDVYRVMGKPLVRKVLEGYNAILIAYGQTGSGKTHTLIGKPEQNVKGVLPFMLEELMNEKSVKSVSISGCEAYGTHVSRIELFDLFNPVNMNLNWVEKQGACGLEPKECRPKKCEELSDCWDIINVLHDSSHFAPTGKNPESSRGHAAFCTAIQQEDPSSGDIMTSHLIVVDLAGSEGESAFTPEFVKKIDPPTLMARRLEAGCINTGLSQLQVVFNELKVKGKLSKTRGTGLRRILHAYINKNCMISVMFTLSPALNNRVTTESTLKFAVQAGMVKVKPVKMKAQVNYKVLVDQLKKYVEEQKQMIEDLNDEIEKLTDSNGDLELDNGRMKKQLGNKYKPPPELVQKQKEREKLALAAGGDSTPLKPKLNGGGSNTLSVGGGGGGSSARRQPSAMNAELTNALELFDANKFGDSYRELNEDDKKSCVANNISETKVDNDIKRIYVERKKTNVDMQLLNDAIVRTPVQMESQQANFDIAANDDKGGGKLGAPKGIKPIKAKGDGVEYGNLGSIAARRAAFQPNTKAFSPYPNEKVDSSQLPSFNDLEQKSNVITAQTFTPNPNMVNKTNTFDGINDMSYTNMSIGIVTFNHADTNAMTREECIDYCDELESKLIEEKTLRFGLERSQEVIIDHLMETNEALLRWFKVKKIL